MHDSGCVDEVDMENPFGAPGRVGLSSNRHEFIVRANNICEQRGARRFPEFDQGALLPDRVLAAQPPLQHDHVARINAGVKAAPENRAFLTVGQPIAFYPDASD